MALAPDDAPWYRRFRMLLVIYGLALVFGVREYMLIRAGETVDPGSDEWSRMADVVAELNPADADTEYLLAMEALKRGDQEGYVHHMETALDKGVKHNNLLLSEYAHHLIRMQAPFEDIDRALNRWRLNHQLSYEILELPMAVGPATPADEAALRRELDSIDWIFRYEIRRPSEQRSEWVIAVQFEPAVEISIRDLAEAMSILGIQPDRRAQFRVRCVSLSQCRPMAR